MIINVYYVFAMAFAMQLSEDIGGIVRGHGHPGDL